jgi:hypothetical protein
MEALAFYNNTILSYWHDMGAEGDKVLDQDRIMFSSVMELTHKAGKDAVFEDPGGSDVFFYRDGVFYFEEDYYDYCMGNHLKPILDKYNCVRFDGIPM